MAKFKFKDLILIFLISELEILNKLNKFNSYKENVSFLLYEIFLVQTVCYKILIYN